ncbi:NAD-dependent histone deacetylase sir2 [Mortierella sp. GBA30]|nr:NAD-dependent histone deacetylase sir2 [Mortierella sp. GBA30]
MSEPTNPPAGHSASAPEDVEDRAKLQVPSEPQAINRPESPVNRKRADDDSSLGQGDQQSDGSIGNNHSLPPSKKSKTSPPLPASPTPNAKTDANIATSGGAAHSFVSSSLTDYRTSNEVAEDALSPQTSPILEPSKPSAPLSVSSMAMAMAYSGEKRYSPVSGEPVQSKARKLDEHDRPSSPPFRPLSPRFQLQRQQEQAEQQHQISSIPSFDRSATAILDSLSKPGENSLGNLNLGTPIIGRTAVGERAMGVITSRPGSRQTSPGPGSASHVRTGSTTLEETIVATGAMRTESTASGAHVDEITYRLESVHQRISGKRGREPSPATAMVTSSDDEHHRISGGLINETTQPARIPEVDSDYEDEEDDEDAVEHQAEMAGVEDSFAYDSDSDVEYDQDLMDEIDVENIGIPESDSDSEGSPYHDPDPMCVDRLTDEETDVILDEARMHGEIQVPASLTENDIIRTFSERLRGVLRRRKRLQNVHSIEHVVGLLKSSKRIMVLTGAGVSVSCGIPDFRSEDGIYSRLSEFELDDPQQMFDLEFFRERPEIFYSFAREIFPSNFIPSPSHYFIRLLEEQGRLLRNYTQNIDTLEQKAGIQRVLQCHGSFATASCVRCGHQVQGDEIKESIFKQEVAYCKVCKTPSPPPKAKAQKKARARYSSSDEDESDEDDDSDPNRALMKPDIVFFGEKLPPLFDQSLKEDREKVDLLIVIGSSLKVAPVSDIMHQLPNAVPQILINRTPNYHMEFDVQLLGNCDTIVAELCRMAGWELKHEKLLGGTSNVQTMDISNNMDGSGTGGRAAWSLLARGMYVFEGADLSERDIMAYRAKEAKSIGESGTKQPKDVAGNSNDSGDDGYDEDERGYDSEESEGVENMEGLTTDTSPRRPPRREERDRSTGLMDVRIDQWEDSGNGEVERAAEDFINVPATPVSTAATAVSGSSLFSPRLHPVHPVGFATGTTEPRSGSITEIHKDILSAAARSTEAMGYDPSVTSALPMLRSPTLAHSTQYLETSKPKDEFDDDEEEVKIRVMFTEKMPKDLGEEDNGDVDEALLHHGRGHLFSHGRQPSVDLEPITEDRQLEADENVVSLVEQDEDEEIEVGGPEAPPSMAPDTDGETDDAARHS